MAFKFSSRIRIGIILCLCVIVFSTPCVTAEARKDEAREHGDEKKITVLINKVAAAYGGREAMESVRSLYAKGRIEAIMRRDSGTYIRYVERERKLRVEITYTRSSEERILNGTEGLRTTDGRRFVKVSGARYSAMLYQYKTLDLPYGLLRGLYEARYAGEDLVNDTKVAVLDLEDGETRMRAYIDTDRGLIRRTDGFFSVEGEATTLSAVFDDFRSVDGTVMPFKITNYAAGMMIGETVIDEYSINPTFDESLWKADDEDEPTADIVFKGVKIPIILISS